jgi:hypothetical protein
MKRRIVSVITLTTLMTCFSASADTTVWIDSVNVIPEQPLETDMITLDIAGRASSWPSEVEYDQFTQNGTSLQLDLYVDMGFTTMISDWTHFKDISPLSAETYTLEVRAFDYQLGTLQDTYAVDFTVVPEPTSLALFSLGLLIAKLPSINFEQSANAAVKDDSSVDSVS